MRAKSLIVFAVAVPLGGCFSLTAQKSVPEWAMAQSQSFEQPRTRVSRAPAPRRVAEERTGSVVMPTNTGNVAMPVRAVRAAPWVSPARAAPTAYTPEWHALENAADEQLRRRMHICNGC